MIDFNIKPFDALDSTQLEARRLVNLGQAHNGLVVLAKTQTAGKGRRDNVWVSQVGNLFCTILLAKPKDVISSGHYSFLLALSVYDAVTHFARNADVKVKWPNDVFLNGAKVAGILLETYEDFLLAGLGVNVVNAPEGKSYLGSHCTSNQVLAACLESLGAWQALYTEQGFLPIRQSWLEKAMALHSPIQAKLSCGAIIEGVFIGLDEQGALLLEREDRSVRAIHSGEVFF